MLIEILTVVRQNFLRHPPSYKIVQRMWYGTFRFLLMGLFLLLLSQEQHQQHTSYVYPDWAANPAMQVN